MLSVKQRQRIIDSLALVFSCQIDKELLKAGMFNAGKNVLPAVSFQYLGFDARDLIFVE
jgi:hypothetical protein